MRERMLGVMAVATAMAGLVVGLFSCAQRRAVTRGLLVLALGLGVSAQAADVRKFHLVDPLEVRQVTSGATASRTLTPAPPTLEPEWSLPQQALVAAGIFTGVVAVVVTVGYLLLSPGRSMGAFGAGYAG